MIEMELRDAIHHEICGIWPWLSREKEALNIDQLRKGKPYDQHRLLESQRDLKTSKVYNSQKNSRRLWRSRRRKSSSVPAGAASFPAAVCLPESAQTLAGIAFRAAENPRIIFQQRRNLPVNLSSREFGQPQPSRVF